MCGGHSALLIFTCCIFYLAIWDSVNSLLKLSSWAAQEVWRQLGFMLYDGTPVPINSAVCSINLTHPAESSFTVRVDLGEIRVDYNISSIIRLLPQKGLRVAGFSGMCEPLIWLTSVMDVLSKGPQLSNNSSNDKESQSGRRTAGLQSQLSTDWRGVLACCGSTC